MYELPPPPRDFVSWRAVHRRLLDASPRATGTTAITYGIAGRKKGGIASSDTMPFSLVAEYAAKEQLNEVAAAPEPLTLAELADLRIAASRYDRGQTSDLFERLTAHVSYLISRRAGLMLLLAAATLTSCHTAPTEAHDHHQEHATPSRNP